MPILLQEVQRCIPPSFMKDPKKEFEVVVLKAGFKIQMIKLDILYTEFDNLESFTGKTRYRIASCTINNY